MFPLAFVAGWLQGDWWGFISRNYVVWPTFLLMNVFIALKGSHFWFLFIISVYISISVCNWSGMSFINIRNRTGPSTETIGTDWRLDTFNPSTTHWDLLERYYSNQRRDVFLTPYKASFCRSISWSTTSKAFLRSKNIAPTMFPLSIWLSHSFINLINAVWQECCFRKPDWASCKSLYLFK